MVSASHETLAIANHGSGTAVIGSLLRVLLVDPCRPCVETSTSASIRADPVSRPPPPRRSAPTPRRDLLFRVDLRRPRVETFFPASIFCLCHLPPPASSSSALRGDSVYRSATATPLQVGPAARLQAVRPNCTS
jgi:hypothetical protein